MPRTAPDDTALFHYPSAMADDAAIKTYLGAAPHSGKMLKVGSNHILMTIARKTALVTGADTVSWPKTDWAVLRCVDITSVAHVKAFWMLRPSFLSAFVMDCQTSGGLTSQVVDDESELCVRLVAAAKIMPVVKVTEDDIIVLDPFATGTWLDDAVTANYMAADGSGRVYAQFRAALGFPCSPAAADTRKPLLTQLPYTFQPLVGDIMGLAPVHQAQLIGNGFVESSSPDKLDFIVPEEQLMGDIFRRAGKDKFSPLFSRRWVTAYPSMASAARRGDGGEMIATASDARQAALAAGLILGYGGTWDQPLMDAVESALKSQVLLLVDTADYSTMSFMDRITSAARSANRVAKSSGSSRGGAAHADTARDAVFDSSEEQWSAAARDPLLRALLSKLATYQTVPFDALQAGAMILKDPSPAGLVFVNTSKVPELQVLKPMTAVRADSTIQSIICAALAFDRRGTARPAWGALAPQQSCVRLVKGKWIKCDKLEENAVVCSSSAAIDWWDAFVRPVVTKEDGRDVALQLAPAGTDALAVFHESKVLLRAQPILKRLFAAIGIDATHAHSFNGLVQNVITRLQRIEALPDSKGQRCAMQALKYAVALAIDEGQRGFALMFASSIETARRAADFYTDNGAAHNAFKNCDALLEVQQKRALEEMFDPDSGEEHGHGGGKKLKSDMSRGYHGDNGPDLCAPSCHECGRSLRGLDVAKLTDPRDGNAYCMPCWSADESDDEADGSDDEAAAAAKAAAAAAEAANAARNKANIGKLRARFPGYCSHQLYYVHVRGKDERCCIYGDAEKCARGSHAVPADLAQKTRDLDLDFA